MKKKYEIPEENTESNFVNEPAIAYGKNQIITSPCQYSIEEMEEQIKIGLKEKEQGLGISHEEMKKRFKK